MTELMKAKKLLEEHNYTYEKVSESYQYLTESMLVDKIKEKIGSLTKKLKSADSDLEKKEIKAQAADLKSEIVSSSTLKAASKKMLLGLLTGLAISAHAGQPNAVDISSNRQDKHTEWNGEGSITEPTPDELKDDAKYVATVFKNANIDGLEVIRVTGESEYADEYADTRTYEFNDGTKVVIEPDNAIYIYDKAALIRQYEPLYPAMKALQKEVNKI